jgi:hypothetical protein
MNTRIEIDDGDLNDLLDGLAAETREFVNERLTAEAEKMQGYVDARFDALRVVAASLRNAQPRLRVSNG